MLHVIGRDGCRGSYILRIEVRMPLQVVFGRFHGSMPLPVDEGAYIYIGSALGQKGAMTLPRRLLRHATRQEGRPPHAIRAIVHDWFQELPAVADCRAVPPKGKRLYWHVDFLLEELASELTAILVIRNPERLETRLADLLLADSKAGILAKGLGATDSPGRTHLLRVPSDQAWWQGLQERLQVWLDPLDDVGLGNRSRRVALPEEMPRVR